MGIKNYKIKLVHVPSENGFSYGTRYKWWVYVEFIFSQLEEENIKEFNY